MARQGPCRYTFIGRWLLSRLAHRAGLVTLRQTFVRRSHAWLRKLPPLGSEGAACPTGEPQVFVDRHRLPSLNRRAAAVYTAAGEPTPARLDFHCLRTARASLRGSIQGRFGRRVRAAAPPGPRCELREPDHRSLQASLTPWW